MSSSITPKTLAEKALVTKISISCFNGIVQDKKITQDTNDANGVKGKRGSYVKRILQGDHLNAILNSQQKLRNYLTKVSLPWLDGGWRLIKSVDFISTKMEIDNLINEFNKNVKDFIDNYQVIQNKDISVLGMAYNPNDYPDVNTMAAKFGVNLIVEKIADSDFRNSGWDAKIIEEMQQNAMKELDERIKNGKIEILERLKETLVHLQERLVIGKFKQSTIDNIGEALNDIRNLNITDDQNLNTLCDNIDSIIPKDGDDIRDNEAIAEMTKNNTKISIDAVDQMITDLLG